MSALRERSTQATPPAAEHPDIIDLGNGDVVLSRVAYWREDEHHIIRSLEYDVIAAGKDLRATIATFVHHTVDYALMLRDAEHRTDDDVELALMIFGRLSRIAAEISETERPTRSGGLIERFRWHRGQSAARGWYLHHAAQN